VFFAVMGVASTLAAYFNVDGSFARPKLAALIFGVFWLAFTCLAIWMLLAYYRSRLFVGANSLRQIGVLRDRQVRFSQVEQLKWRRFPQGGSVRMGGDLQYLAICGINAAVVAYLVRQARRERAASDSRG
jgi:phage shock protein PspC (stress-responsive transcriptional regulator)